MQKKRLGCITPAGLLAGAITLLVIAVLGAVRGGQMFSPGALNAQASTQQLGGVMSHAGTGGECGACHARPWERQDMSDHCLACHTDLTSDPQNFHGVMLAQSQTSECSGCHPDHRGAQAALTRFDTRGFPHLSLGYSLQAHRKTASGDDFTCRDCHDDDLTQFNITVCSDCHAQINAEYIQTHRAVFAESCLACHDGVDRYGGEFDHNRYFFPLEGKHSTLPCQDCHAGARTPEDLQNTVTGCFDCHAQDDTHQGGYGPNCAACHTPVDWKQATFDHSKSAFPLDGKHVDVACEGCHANNTFKGTPKDCTSCHTKDDAHQGSFGLDCAECHNTAGWSPAHYNRPHTFPINHGEGGDSPCATCHPDSLLTYTCYGCHEHNQAEIAAEHAEEGISDFTDCMECHPTGEEEEGEGD